MTPPIKDRVVLVTGAGSGFGRLVSQKCAALGARLMCADIDDAAAAATAESIRAAGGQAAYQAVDVTSSAQMVTLAAATITRFGAVDVLVNNAGTMPLAFYRDHAVAMGAWDRCIDVNVKGVLNGIVAVYDQMIAQGRGHVINLSSIYGNFPVAGAGVYGATKAAVNFLSESLRVESQGRIKVTVVRPTGVPATNLAAGIINPEATLGIKGHNAADVDARFEAWAAGQLPANELDRNDIGYFALDPESLADQIVYAINQPWGVSIAEITVRASGEGYVL
ncbi:MAG: SDR family NAD(P)-dependent oxidoreductase [Pseudomonadales bacterium]